MRKEVNMNLPMFIIIVIIIVSITSVLVYGVNIFKTLMQEDKIRMENKIDNIEEYYNLKKYNTILENSLGN